MGLTAIRGGSYDRSVDLATARRLRPTIWCVAVISLLAALAVPSAARASGLTRGFADSVFMSPDAAHQTPAQWDSAAARLGAKLIQVEVDWARYEPRRPRPGDNTANPAGKAYRGWAALDQTVRGISEQHMQAVFLVDDAPAWAQAPHSPSWQTEAYEPDDRALEQFVYALARRYGGGFADPDARGQMLPRVRYFQAWPEANLSVKLAPQLVDVGGVTTNLGAAIYRKLLNAFYAGVKRAVASDVVIFSGLAPYGGSIGRTQRVAPVTFLENVLCLSGTLARLACSDPAHFDVLAADPYDIGSPTTPAINPDDASAPDLGKLTHVLDAAISDHTVLPDARKPLWVTGFSYDSDPPNSASGQPLAIQARWLEDSLYVFWKEGVSAVLWNLIRDQPGRNWNTSYYSGVFFHDGQRKPSYRAYEFPLVVAADGKAAQIWGIAPTAGTVAVQQQIAGRWRTIRTFHTAGGSVFAGMTAAPDSGQGDYRATEGPLTSLVWSY